jgi:UDP-3-O-[3-hydroxymyristoyl] glucosamine N-acyltransferase
VDMKLGMLADALAAQLRGDGQINIHAVATLADAGPGDISFLANRRYRPQLDVTRASAVILAAEFAQDCPVAALVTDNPYLGYARAAALLNPVRAVVGGRHRAAIVAAGASVDVDAWIDAAAVVEDGARIGARTSIGPGCVIGRDVVIGSDCRLVANVTLCRAVSIGQRVLIHPGVVVGGDGFGIANDDGVWVKVPQLGAVDIGDDVEIGANSTIDRGALNDTIIGRGVKIDNLVQENRAWRRNVIRMRHLDDMARQLKSLHAAVKRLSGSD